MLHAEELVVKDDPHMLQRKMQTPGILGTNVIKGFNYEPFVQYGPSLFDDPSLTEAPEWRPALRHCQAEELLTTPWSCSKQQVH